MKKIKILISPYKPNLFLYQRDRGKSIVTPRPNDIDYSCTFGRIGSTLAFLFSNAMLVPRILAHQFTTYVFWRMHPLCMLRRSTPMQIRLHSPTSCSSPALPSRVGHMPARILGAYICKCNPTTIIMHTKTRSRIGCFLSADVIKNENFPPDASPFSCR